MSDSNLERGKPWQGTLSGTWGGPTMSDMRQASDGTVPVTIAPLAWRGLRPCEFVGRAWLVYDLDGMRFEGVGQLRRRRVWWRWLGWYAIGWWALKIENGLRARFGREDDDPDVDDPGPAA